MEVKETPPPSVSGEKYPSLCDLPPEITLEIMSNLSPGDCHKMSLTCRSFNDVFDNELLWKRLCWTQFNIRLDLDSV